MKKLTHINQAQDVHRQEGRQVEKLLFIKANGKKIKEPLVIKPLP